MSDFEIFNGLLKNGRGSVGDVVIPDSVTHINAMAFYHCNRLTGVVIPDSVKSIGYSAFSGCSSLTNVVIPDSVTSIGESAFSGCSNLASAVIPDSVTSIGKGAFGGEGMEALIIFSDILTEKLKLRSDMFAAGVHILAKNISSIPVNHRTQAAVDFVEDERFKDVDRASYLKYIKSNAAKLVDEAMAHPALLALMCSEKYITANTLETYIEAAQKTGNAELNAMMLDYSTKVSEESKEKVVKAKEKQAEAVFERIVQRQSKKGIKGLTFVVAGELKTFKKHSDLKKFIESKGAKLGGSISTKVDYLIMNDEKSDSEKRKRCDELGIEIIDEYEFNELANRVFEIKKGTLLSYYGHGGALVIPNRVKSIGNLAFLGCSRLTSVVIPDSVTSIGNYAFQGCSNLTSVVIPDSVERIGEFALSDCNGLTSVVIPNSVTSIGFTALWGCKNLVIRVHEESYALEFAIKNSIKYEIY